MFGRKLGFWLAVGGVAVLANFGLELAASTFPNLPGLRAFVDFTHCGPGKAA